MTAADIDRLAVSRFVRLTTYRRDGTAVGTPVWVARRSTPAGLDWREHRQGEAAPPYGRGHDRGLRRAGDATRGEPLHGAARLLPDRDLGRVKRLLARKYRLGWPALTVFNRLVRLVTRRLPGHEVGIEITLS